ncbi:hypothetical protein BAURA86_00884 [Brevibacterium aurantiacum]|uniref:Uncharacterized protein n=1 Tax=Brevibacterium aurantiacum TaxID=273384 RepID=A0A2H1IR14_BREAU|nr:hypothetical protein BAURA86_00884 [Brevibacterium aurantiacum]
MTVPLVAASRRVASFLPSGRIRDTGGVSEINFARYRAYVDARVEANNAMIALLAGSRLAAHNLQLHNGSPHQLPGLFPAVKDIDRFNLLPDRASQLLLDADAHLAAVAIPYALAVYEAFVKDAITMLEDAGYAVSHARGALNAGRMHTTFFDAAGVAEPADVIPLFHVLRCLRNAQIHHAGQVTQEVTEALDSLTQLQRERWEQLTMLPLDSVIKDRKLHFTIGHLIAAFAVTKEAARRINEVLRQKLSRETWAKFAVADFAESAEHPRNSRQWKKGLLGFARFHYLGGLNLSSAELELAARASGFWTATSW